MDTQKEIELFEELLIANPDFDASLLAKDEDGNYENCEISDLLGIFQAGIEIAEREARMNAKAQAVLKSPVMAFDEWFRNRHEKTGLYEQASWGKDDATYIRHEMRKAFQAGLKENKVIREGFILVPKEPTLEMCHRGRNTRSFKVQDIYKAMIEAQEQSHD